MFSFFIVSFLIFYLSPVFDYFFPQHQTFIYSTSVDLKGLLLPAMFYLRAVWYALINSRGHVFLMSSSFYQEQLHFLPSEDMEIKASREGCQLASQSPQPGW